MGSGQWGVGSRVQRAGPTSYSPHPPTNNTIFAPHTPAHILNGARATPVVARITHKVHHAHQPTCL